MNKVYNIVVIGCGHMAAAHLDNIYYKDNICVYGVVDVVEEKAELYKRKYGALSYSTDYKSYLKDDNVDIVIVCTYPSSHLSILKDCLDHNKHVLCEKPIATDLKEGCEFVRLVKSSNSKVLVGHILRHNESYNKIKELIDNDVIGSPLIVRMVQNHHAMDWNKYLNLIKDTSPIIDCGIHYIDVIEWLTGESISSVSGICQRTEVDVPPGKYNYGMINMNLSKGSVAFYEAGWGKTVAASNIKEFIGPKGRLTLTLQRDRMSNKEEGDLIEYFNNEDGSYNTINVNCSIKSTYEQLVHLINMIENNVKAKPTIDEVFHAFEVAFKAHEAITTKNMISI